MPLQEAIIPSRYAHPLLQMMQAGMGDVLDATLTEAGLTGFDAAAGTVLTITQFSHLMLAASRHLQRSDIAYELGRRLTIETHDTLGRVIAGCATLEQALVLTQRYYKLITPCFGARYTRGIGRGKSHSEFVVRMLAPVEHAALPSILELHAVTIHTQILGVLGNTTGLEVHLSCPPPAHIARYKELQPTRFHFSEGGMPEVRALIPINLADAALPRALRGGESATDLKTPEMRLAGGYGEWIEMMLRETENVQPTLASLAEVLSMSPRSLTRRLAADGVNLRTLALRVRHERACRMLADTAWTQTQISLRLGYADESGFVRAFQNVEGVSPGVWRRRLGSA